MCDAHWQQKEKINDLETHIEEQIQDYEKRMKQQKDEYELILGRRDREHEEGHNLLSMLKTDLDRLQTERSVRKANLGTLHSGTLKRPV